MKKTLTVMAISVAILLAALPLAYAQDKPPAQAAEKVFQGQLTKVDAQTKTIMVKGDTEMTFEYTDATQVVGPEKNVQGLAGKPGTLLRVTYREAAGKNIAIRIETAEKR